MAERDAYNVGKPSAALLQAMRGLGDPVARTPSQHLLPNAACFCPQKGHQPDFPGWSRNETLFRFFCIRSRSGLWPIQRVDCLANGWNDKNEKGVRQHNTMPSRVLSDERLILTITSHLRLCQGCLSIPPGTLTYLAPRFVPPTNAKPARVLPVALLSEPNLQTWGYELLCARRRHKASMCWPLKTAVLLPEIESLCGARLRQLSPHP